MPHQGQAGAWRPTALSTPTRGSASAMWGRSSKQVSERRLMGWEPGTGACWDSAGVNGFNRGVRQCRSGQMAARALTSCLKLVHAARGETQQASSSGAEKHIRQRPESLHQRVGDAPRPQL